MLTGNLAGLLLYFVCEIKEWIIKDQVVMQCVIGVINVMTACESPLS